MTGRMSRRALLRAGGAGAAALGQQPLPSHPVRVRWEIAHDEGMRRRVGAGTALA